MGWLNIAVLIAVSCLLIFDIVALICAMIIYKRLAREEEGNE